MSRMPESCKHRLEIVYRAIDDLKPNPANPRQHSKKQIRKLANSIDTFGFNVPILLDAELNIAAGHGRVAAGRVAGLFRGADDLDRPPQPSPAPRLHDRR